MAVRGHATERGGMQIRDQAGPIRMILVDDHIMFRQGIAGVLTKYDGLKVVG